MENLRLGIIDAVSTILLQWTAMDDEKEFNGEYWVYPRCASMLYSEDGDVLYSLSTKKIDDKWCLELRSYTYNVYGGEKENLIQGYIPIHDPKRNCWELAEYCKKVGALINCEF